MGIYNIYWTPDPSNAFNNLLSTQGADGAYRLSPGARVRFVTDAESVQLDIVSDIYGTYPSFAKIGVLVDGAVHATITANQAAMKRYTQSLPAGAGKVVEFVVGLQAKPSSTILGTFIKMITFPQNTNTSISSGPGGAKLLIYGDSIAVGADATNPATEGWGYLISEDWAGQTIQEAYGSRSLNDDASDSTARAAFVAKVAAASPSAVWLAIGTNDYGLNKWTAANFGTAYAALLDDLHTALPSATIYCQTPLTRFSPASEAANGSGSTLGNYRTQIATAQAARSSYCTLVAGPNVITDSALMNTDGIHPLATGHATIYAAVKTALGI